MPISFSPFSLVCSIAVFVAAFSQPYAKNSSSKIVQKTRRHPFHDRNGIGLYFVHFQ